MKYKKYKFGGHNVPGMYMDGGAFGNSMGGGKPIKKRMQDGGPPMHQMPDGSMMPGKTHGDTLKGEAPQMDPSKMSQKQMTDAERKFMMNSIMMKRKAMEFKKRKDALMN